MKEQRFAEAEQVYREDLARLREKGWSLLGLTESLRKQNKNADEVARTQPHLKTSGRKPASRSHFVSVSAADVSYTDFRCGRDKLQLGVNAHQRTARRRR